LFTAHSKINDLEPGRYVALLLHSGSRGMVAWTQQKLIQEADAGLLNSDHDHWHGFA
jgi:hypothetical protein